MIITFHVFNPLFPRSFLFVALRLIRDAHLFCPSSMFTFATSAGVFPFSAMWTYEVVVDSISIHHHLRCSKATSEPKNSKKPLWLTWTKLCSCETLRVNRTFVPTMIALIAPLFISENY